MELPVLTCQYCGKQFVKTCLAGAQYYCGYRCRRSADNERKKSAVKKVKRVKRNTLPEEGLNRKLQSGKPYAEIQKAETVEMYARVKI